MSFEVAGSKDVEEYGGLGEHHLAVDLPIDADDEGLAETDPDVEIMRDELARERRLRKAKGVQACSKH